MCFIRSRQNYLSRYHAINSYFSRLPSRKIKTFPVSWVYLIPFPAILKPNFPLSRHKKWQIPRPEKALLDPLCFRFEIAARSSQVKKLTDKRKLKKKVTEIQKCYPLHLSYKNDYYMILGKPFRPYLESKPFSSRKNHSYMNFKVPSRQILKII